MGARPGIGLSTCSWLIFLLIGFDFPNRQHVVVGLQLAVQICFIIRGKWFEPRHDGMLWLDDLGRDGIHGMPPKLTSYQLHIGIRVPETIGRTMDGQKALARCHKIQQCFFFCSREYIPVGENHQGVIFGQGLGVQVAQVICIGDVDALGAECRHQLGHPLDRLMVSLVAKKQYFNATRLLRECSREQQGEGEEEFHTTMLKRLKGLKWLRGLKTLRRLKGLKKTT